MSMSSDDEASYYSLYSETQQKVLAVLPYLSAPLSALGSAVIIYVIVRDARRQHTRIQTYQRFMLGISLMDVVPSVGITIFGHWAMPAGTPYVYGARGNQATCAANFFFVNCLYGSLHYTLFLVVYLMLLVRFHWPRKRFARWVEPWVHITAVANLLLIPVAMATTENNSVRPSYVLPGVCWNLNDPCVPGEDNVDCMEASGGSSIGKLLYVVCIFGTMMVCFTLLVLHLRKTDHYLQRHAVSPPGEDSRRIRRDQGIAVDALLFMGALVVVYASSIPLLLLPTKPQPTNQNRSLFFALSVLTKLLIPSQGILNAYIFLRGKLVALDQQGQGHMSLGMFVAYLNDTATVVPTDQGDSSSAHQMELAGAGVTIGQSPPQVQEQSIAGCNDGEN